MHNKLSYVCCPRCLSSLTIDEAANPRRWFCSKQTCLYASLGFPSVSGQPILIDFERSIVTWNDVLARDGDSVVVRDINKVSLKNKVKRLLFGENKVAAVYAKAIVAEMRNHAHRPRLLVIGGGTIGSGVRELYDSPEIEIIGTDVYASPHTQMIADGHQLPFVAQSFDGVWIQAVLEHVLDPNKVVAEIHRVLKPNGVVYADTPFMQQVHENAYDFTRFTLSGHRWLFRNFTLFSAGPVAGAGTATIWSIRYLVRSLTNSDKLGTAVSILLFWLRFLDNVARTRPNADAACGVFFFGRRSSRTINPQAIVRFYEEQKTVKAPEAFVPASAHART